jgi:hypothetical protein
VKASHGRITAKAVQLLGPSCHAAGFFLDGVDCADDLLYQSPERLAGDGKSPEDDTWALGVLLYYSLTGAMPFAGEEAPELRARILWSRPKPLATFGIENACLQRVMDHVLAPDLAGRIQTVTVLRARLVQCLPAADKLPALKLGKPDLRALSDETDDSQGVKLTGVIARDEMERQIREVIARRKAARAARGRDAPPLVPEPWSEADTTRRRKGEPPTQVRPLPAEPPTMVRPNSVMQSAASLAVDASRPSGYPVPAEYEDPTADTSVSGPRSRVQSQSGDLVHALGQTSPTRIGIDPDATLQRSDAIRFGSRTALAVGSGVRPSPSAFAESDGFVSVDTADSTDSGPSLIDLSWDDVPESEVPASARAATSGLVPTRAPTAPSLGPGRQFELEADDSVFIPNMRPRWPKLVGAALLVLVGGGLAYGLLAEGGPEPALPAPVVGEGGPSETAAPPESTPSPGAAGAASGPSSAPLGGPAAASSSAAVAAHGAWPRGPGETSACVAALFPKDTIKAGAPEFDFVCTERNANQGATDIRVALVRSRRQPGAPAAMRELDELGWYQLALFAIARGSCCEHPRPLETSFVKHTCPLDERLEQVGRAARTADEPSLREALEGFVQATKCLARQGAAAAFGEMRPTSSGAAALLHKMIARRQDRRSR